MRGLRKELARSSGAYTDGMLARLTRDQRDRLEAELARANAARAEIAEVARRSLADPNDAVDPTRVRQAIRKARRRTSALRSIRLRSLPRRLTAS